MNKFEVKTKHEISDEDIDGLMVTALEGGINYWCRSATIKRDEDGTMSGVTAEGVIYASDVISKGGTLILTDVEEPDEKWELTLPLFLQGLTKAMEWGEFGSVSDLMDGHDAETVDVLIQYAVFNDIVFG